MTSQFHQFLVYKKGYFLWVESRRTTWPQARRRGTEVVSPGYLTASLGWKSPTSTIPVVSGEVLHIMERYGEGITWTWVSWPECTTVGKFEHGTRSERKSCAHAIAARVTMSQLCICGATILPRYGDSKEVISSFRDRRWGIFHLLNDYYMCVLRKVIRARMIRMIIVNLEHHYIPLYTRQLLLLMEAT